MDIEAQGIPYNELPPWLRIAGFLAPSVGAGISTLADYYLSGEPPDPEILEDAEISYNRKRPLPEDTETVTTTTTSVTEPEKKKRRTAVRRRSRARAPIKKTLVAAIKHKLAECKEEQKLLNKDLRSLITKRAIKSRTTKVRRRRNAKKKKGN